MTPFKAEAERMHGQPSLHEDVATTALWISIPVSHEHSVMYSLPSGEREYAGHFLHCSLIAGFHSPAAHADGSDTHVNAYTACACAKATSTATKTRLVNDMVDVSPSMRIY